MDKSRQPNMWSYHDIPSVDQEALERSERQSRIREIKDIVSNPDTEEKVDINKLDGRDSFVGCLDSKLVLKTRYSLGGDYKTFKYVTTAKVFDSHETTPNADKGFTMEYHTSVAAFDLFSKDTEYTTKAADLLLFRLSASMPGEPEPKIAVEDTAWGRDCAFGALITDGNIQWFRLGMTGDKIVEGEVRREDITEESGEKVAMRLVRNREPERKIEFIDSRDNAALTSELNEELDKFIASRQPKASS